MSPSGVTGRKADDEAGSASCGLTGGSVASDRALRQLEAAFSFIRLHHRCLIIAVLIYAIVPPGVAFARSRSICIR